jgi:hypothetical protein
MNKITSSGSSYSDSDYRKRVYSPNAIFPSHCKENGQSTPSEASTHNAQIDEKQEAGVWYVPPEVQVASALPMANVECHSNHKKVEETSNCPLRIFISLLTPPRFGEAYKSEA